ncbi:MAG TPA: type VI secretion system baseplate subunit TssE [Bryobacteraceae bacterium]|jgi:type VI secretion system protein ImpF
MPRWQPEEVVTQSVIERLIDHDPKAGADAPPTRNQSLRLLKASLRRDLEWLLNTRRTPEPAGSEYAELENSLFNYGVPDVSTLSWESHTDRARLARVLEQALLRFEPRIDHVKVTPLDAGQGLKHVLRFQIEGLLLIDPAPEVISFDTTLQLSSGEYQVKGEPSAG